MNRAFWHLLSGVLFVLVVIGAWAAVVWLFRKPAPDY